MKKYGVFLALASTILLAGCGDKGQNMTFDEAYTAFGQSLPHISIPAPELSGSSAYLTKIDVNISSAQGFSASGQIIGSGMYDNISGAANMDMTVKGKAFEPSFGSNILIDGLLHIVNDTKNSYMYIDKFSVAPETGQADGGIISAVIGTISRKWIQLSQTGMGGIPSYRNNALSLMSHLQEGLHQYNLFTGTEKTTIDGHAAYKLAWNPEGVSGFVQYLLQDAKNLGKQVSFSGDTVAEVTKGLLDSPLVGYLIIKDKDDIELRIDSLKTTDLGDLSFSLSHDGATMKLADLADNTTIMTGSIQGDEDGIIFHVTMPANNLSILAKSSNEMKNWMFQFSIPEAQITLNIQGESHSIDNFTIPAVGKSTPLTQILQGFSMLGGAMDTTGVEATNNKAE